MKNLFDPECDKYLRSKWFTNSAVLYKKIVEHYEKKDKDLDLTKIGTLELRDIAEEVGYNYWDSLEDSNAIDWIDSYLAKIK